MYVNYQQTLSRYIYPCEYVCNAAAANAKTLELSDCHGADNGQFYVVGTRIPEMVHPLTNETTLDDDDDDKHARMFVFSDKPLTETSLDLIAKYFDYDRFPSYAVLVASPTTLPYCQNFILADERVYARSLANTPNAATLFVEYKFFERRFKASTRFTFDARHPTKTFCIVPPTDCTSSFVLIMPDTFTRCSSVHGYFFDPVSNLLVRAYSRHKWYLTGGTPPSPSPSTSEDSELRNAFDLKTDDRILYAVERFFARLGVHAVYAVGSTEIVGTDGFLSYHVGGA